VHFTEYDTRTAAYAVIVDGEQILLTWFNGGPNAQRACWSLPGGGVEYDESIEDAIIREAKEETGYDIELGVPLTTDSFTAPRGLARPDRPYKSFRILYTAVVTGGRLGTLEVGGTTDWAAWLPIEKVAGQPHADIVDIGIRSWQRFSTLDQGRGED
jgi:8-oxo-dGTP diphosphatase